MYLPPGGYSVRPMRLHVLALPLVAFAIVGPGPGPASAPAARCLPAVDFGFPATAELRGHVDGDRRIDTVSTSADWVDSESCQASLVVKTARRTYRQEVGNDLGILIAPPPIAALVPLDRRRGLEIAVQVWQGASTGFVELYGIRGARLVRLDQHPFAFSGSLTHQEGLDCTRRHGALLVAGSAAIHGDGYAVGRRFYAMRAGELRLLPRLTEYLLVGLEDLGRFPEISDVPFPRCAVIRAD
jgi:hypothetical protein